LQSFEVKFFNPNSDLEKGSSFSTRHCEHLKGACLHAEVLVFMKQICAQPNVPARKRACALKRSGAQAWQSHREKRDCFASLAKTVS
jgi:hypothetical protein